ncbi:hypothetical protein DFH06DRAFT_1334017 [Mycena polygramma]|nr:hypothetical protein DFH06DRAFT_1334017 [Mycena polygramma]
MTKAPVRFQSCTTNDYDVFSPYNMHHCLKIAEIVDMICSHLDARTSERPAPGVRPLRDLAVLARTCAILHSPALDYLWSHASLGKLLTRCMPSDLWDVVITATNIWTSERRVQPLRTIRASDWDRLCIYARHVKHLSSGVHRDFDLSAIFPSLGVSLPPDLFPKLQSLDWQHTSRDFHYIHLLLHPRLTAISFRLDSESSASLLSTLTLKCPKLIDVDITARDGGQSFIGPLSDFVRGLHNPEEISVPCLAPDVLEHLSHLITLKVLSLHGMPSLSALPTHGGRRTFPALDALSLDLPAIGPATQFLRLCNAVPLVTFVSHLSGIVTADEVHHFLTEISAGFSHFSLTSLTLNNKICKFEELVGSNVTTHVIQPRSMRALLCFHNLTLLSITSVIGFDLDDGTLAELARAWPRIASLALKSNYHHTRTPRATAACLLSFAEHCPRLSRLTLAFDATTIPAAESPAPVQHSLTMLNVQQSPMTTPIDMARFISGLFPTLTKLDTYREHDYNEEEDGMDDIERDVIRIHYRWKEVQSFLGTELSAVPEEESA